MPKHVVLVAALAVLGCTKPQRAPVAAQTPKQLGQPPRTFSEKLQCATVGERWEKVMCVDEHGRRNPLCAGWWAYYAKRDTCVGVFVTTSYANRKQFQVLNAFDLLTGVELQDTCMQQACPVDAAKARWILGETEPSSPASPTAAK